MTLRDRLRLAAPWLALGSATAAIASIWLNQVLLAAALLAILAGGAAFRFPPVRLPLALFFLFTLLSVAFSWNPAAGWPQIRKFYVFLLLPVVFTAFRAPRHPRLLLYGWLALGAAGGLLALGQFAYKWHAASAAGADFYDTYVSDRITGFMSHWMTFGGQAMIALLLGLAWLLFAGEKHPARRLALAAALAVLASAILLGFTRGVWLATAAGALYLLWCWRPRYAALLPLIAAAALLAGPASLRQRALSMVNPQGQLDSNSHRAVCYRAGIAMAAAHPWLGVGPELVGPDLMNHLPADVRPPLPNGWYAHLHSIYIHYAAERGIPAALVLMWLLIKMLMDFIKALRKEAAVPAPRRAWLHGAVAVILAILIEGLFELNLGDSEVLAMFLIVVGSAYAFLYPPPEEAADAR